MKTKTLALIPILLVGLLFYVTCAEEKGRLSFDLKDYEKREVLRNEYTYSGNWDKFIQKDARLMVAYKIVSEADKKETEYIGEIIYYIDRNDEVMVLGRLSVNNGFQDAFGKQFVADKNLHVGSEFMRKDLVGFSSGLIKTPFFVKGIGRMRDTGGLYETEVLTRIEIDDIQLSIIEHKSNY